MNLDRQQVLAYRINAHGLHRDIAEPFDLDVLALGVQWMNTGSVRTALAARLPDPKATDVLADERFAVLWSYRGAPHLLRRADLPELALALWPVSETDAMSRLAAERKPLKEAGIGGLEAFTKTAKAIRKVVGKPTRKGDVSAGVTALLPAPYSYECRSCKATHVYGGLFQLAGLPAGVQLDPTADKTTLTPLTDRPAVPSKSAGPSEPLRAYLRVHGPGTPADAAGYLGTTAAAIRPWWPTDLVEVNVDGKRAWLTEDGVERIRQTPKADDVIRLLPAYDPFLQARDRELLVPDRERQKEVWRILGNPGAVLAGGDVAGTWRAKAGKRNGLDITVTPFGKQSKGIRTAIESEAERVAEVRGAADVTISYEG